MVPPTGFEPVTPGFSIQCSTKLSYSGKEIGADEWTRTTLLLGFTQALNHLSYIGMVLCLSALESAETLLFPAGPCIGRHGKYFGAPV